MNHLRERIVRISRTQTSYSRTNHTAAQLVGTHYSCRHSKNIYQSALPSQRLHHGIRENVPHDDGNRRGADAFKRGVRHRPAQRAVREDADEIARAHGERDAQKRERHAQREEKQHERVGGEKPSHRKN